MKTTKRAPQQPAGTTISHSSFTANAAPPNKHTAAAVQALANAVSKNAEAVIAVAAALRGAPGTTAPMVEIRPRGEFE